MAMLSARRFARFYRIAGAGDGAVPRFEREQLSPRKQALRIQPGMSSACRQQTVKRPAPPIVFEDQHPHVALDSGDAVDVPFPRGAP